MKKEDEIKSCAKMYQNYIDNNFHYKIRIFDTVKIQDCELSFTSRQFKHLSGLHKLIDIVSKKETSNSFFVKIMKGYFTFEDACKSSFLIDDTDVPTVERNGMSKKAREDETILKSELLDRLLALGRICDLINSISPQNEQIPIVSLKIYHWKRDDGSPNCYLQRPNFSKINADLLLEFYDDSKPIKPYTCLFIKKDEKTGLFVGVSLAVSDKSLSRDSDESIRKRKEYAEAVKEEFEIELLSFIEYNNDNPNNGTVLKKCSSERMLECERLTVEHEERMKVEEINEKMKEEARKAAAEIESRSKKIEEAAKKCVDDLNTLHIKYIKNPSDKSWKNYIKQLERLSDRTKYPDDVLKLVRDKLSQLSDALFEYRYDNNDNSVLDSLKESKAFKIHKEFYKENFIDKIWVFIEGGKIDNEREPLLGEIKVIDRILAEREKSLSSGGIGTTGQGMNNNNVQSIVTNYDGTGAIPLHNSLQFIVTETAHTIQIGFSKLRSNFNDKITPMIQNVKSRVTEAVKTISDKIQQFFNKPNTEDAPPSGSSSSGGSSDSSGGTPIERVPQPEPKQEAPEPVRKPFLETDLPAPTNHDMDFFAHMYEDEPEEPDIPDELEETAPESKIVNEMQSPEAAQNQDDVPKQKKPRSKQKSRSDRSER